MPKEYLQCVESEMQKGKSKDEAQKVCAISFYKRHGMTPKEAEKVMAENSNQKIYSIILANGEGEEKNGMVEGQPIEVLRSGVWHHQSYGKIDITPKMLEDIVSNWQKAPMKERMIGYPEQGRGTAHSGAEAAGWIKKVFTKDGSLYAVPSWVKSFAQKIKDGIYRYISAEVDLNFHDITSGKKVGPFLVGAALTNTPAMEGMAPVSLDHGGADNGLCILIYKPQIQDSLDLDQENENKRKELRMELEKKVEILDSENKELKLKLETAGKETKTEKDRADAAETKLAEFEMAAKKEKAEVLWLEAVKKGEVLPKQKEKWFPILLEDSETFKSLTAGVKAVDLTSKGSGQDDETKILLTEAEKKACRAAGITEEKFLESKKMLLEREQGGEK